MKTVAISRDFDVIVQAAPRVVRHYRGGQTYPDVLEFDVAAIVAAGAGDVVVKQAAAAAGAQEKPATRRAKHRRRNG
jgi:hypothetical protein